MGEPPLDAAANDRSSGHANGVTAPIGPVNSTTAHNTPVLEARGNEIVSGPPRTSVAENTVSRRAPPARGKTDPISLHRTPPPDKPSTMAGESSPVSRRMYTTTMEDGPGATKVEHRDEHERGGEGDGCSLGTMTWSHPAAAQPTPVDRTLRRRRSSGLVRTYRARLRGPGGLRSGGSRCRSERHADSSPAR
jgi:hypothetical protein